MTITSDSSPTQAAPLDIGNQGSTQNVSLKQVHLGSSESLQDESKNLLDSIIQKNIRDFVAGQTAVNAEKAASTSTDLQECLLMDDLKVVKEGLPTSQHVKSDDLLTSTKIVVSLEETDCDQVIWDTDSYHSVHDMDGDLIVRDAPDHLLDQVSSQKDGSADPVVVDHDDQLFQEPQVEEDTPSLEIGINESRDILEEGEIVTPERAFSRKKGATSRDILRSTPYMDSYRPGGRPTDAKPSSDSQTPVKKWVRRPASVCRLNIPRELLANLRCDARFDKYCHSWISRPDFCGRGDSCFYAHMYPPGTVEEFGIVTLDIDSDGSLLRGQDSVAELRESRWSRYLLPGRQEFTPGCYDRLCKDFERNICRHGAECWYQHSTDPTIIRRRQGVVWRSKVDTKLEAIAKADGSFMKSSAKSDLFGHNRAHYNRDYYGSPWRRTRTSSPPSDEKSQSYERRDYSQKTSQLDENWKEASIASWNEVAKQNAKEYAGQQEKLAYHAHELRKRQIENGLICETPSTIEARKGEDWKPNKESVGIDEKHSGGWSDGTVLTKGDKDESVDGQQVTEKVKEGILISFL
ncbi:hypothetical protein L873DRAFT_265739 [Choiromyces venosus 120613-1]|uniref:C3H1-type domain-containing protein n=1 Tax=Choiromyces venosus 120613-1 TaxID=1336337 RepID=A0A3N4J109_9PEZI|nr:hypothetical protein L873DRAFT_265739 [Choiromyces venosus 120613-1]